MEINYLTDNFLLSEFEISSSDIKSASVQTDVIDEIETTRNVEDFDEWTRSLEKLSHPVKDNYLQIITKHQEILKIREGFRPFIESIKEGDSFYQELASLSTKILENGTYQVEFLTSVSDGISGTYLLIDKSEKPQFVIKPFDEEAGCINNPKWFAGQIFESNPVRNWIPLYRSAMRETLAYQVALKIGVDSIAPKTVLAIVEADQFYDYSKLIPPHEIARYLEDFGPIDKEKLCSVQQYVPNSQPLADLLYGLYEQGLSEKEIASQLDQNDFENANLLLWVTYDTDGHLWNFLAYPKGIDAFENEIYGIKKIDNGLSFPDKNCQFRNSLMDLENANLPLSDLARAKIEKINIEELAELFKIYGLESAIPALGERIPALQKICEDPEITINQINEFMLHNFGLNHEKNSISTSCDYYNYQWSGYETSS